MDQLINCDAGHLGKGVLGLPRDRCLLCWVGDRRALDGPGTQRGHRAEPRLRRLPAGESLDGRPVLAGRPSLISCEGCALGAYCPRVYSVLRSDALALGSRASGRLRNRKEAVY